MLLALRECKLMTITYVSSYTDATEQTDNLFSDVPSVY